MIKEFKIILIDSSVLVKIFNGDHDNTNVLKTINELKEKNVPYFAGTTLVNFLRAMWLSNSESKLQYGKMILETIEIIVTKELDFKDPQKVRKDMIMTAKNLEFKFRSEHENN